MGFVEATKEAVQGIAKITAQSSEVLTNLTPNPAPLEIDPGETGGAIAGKLEDFRIPQVLKELLAASLLELGFEIKTVDIKSMPGLKPGSGDLIQNTAGGRSVLHLPRKVLEDQLVWQSVGLIIQRFQFSNQILLIVSEGLETAHVFFDTIGKPMWAKKDTVDAIFLPWTHLVPNPPIANSDRLSVLPKLLKLEELITKAQNMPTVKPSNRLPDTEIGPLVTILSAIKFFIDEGVTGWRTQLDQAGLTPYSSKIDFEGNTSTRAYSVLNQLRDWPPLADKPEDQPVGRFLCQIITIQELKTVDKDHIKKIVRDYNLAPSAKDI